MVLLILGYLCIYSLIFQILQNFPFLQVLLWFYDYFFAGIFFLNYGWFQMENLLFLFSHERGRILIRFLFRCVSFLKIGEVTVAFHFSSLPWFIFWFFFLLFILGIFQIYQQVTLIFQDFSMAPMWTIYMGNFSILLDNLHLRSSFSSSVFSPLYRIQDCIQHHFSYYLLRNDR